MVFWGSHAGHQWPEQITTKDQHQDSPDLQNFTEQVIISAWINTFLCASPYLGIQQDHPYVYSTSDNHQYQGQILTR